MSIPDFSLRLQEGITGGFAPPTPKEIVTLLSIPSQNLLKVQRAVRADGTPSLGEFVPKDVPAEDHTVKLVDELRDILQSIPTESPPGSEDIYRMDTSIAFQMGDFEWCNGGPEGCGGGTSDVVPTDEQINKFKRAVTIVKELQAKD